MKFKLDENFGMRTYKLFLDYGHDVETVLTQKLQGCNDHYLYNICCAEQRCLVTFDLDFADVTRFPPSEAHGIAVIRVPQNPSLFLLEQLITNFLQTLVSLPIIKKLWIVEIGRIRIHESDPD